MRKAFLLFTLVSFTFASCVKRQNNKPTTYVVNGVHDVTLMDNTQSLDLQFLYMGPVQENVMLDVTGLPQGVIKTISVAEGVPTFYSNISFSDMSAIPGTYPAQLVCTGTETGEKTYDFNVKVKNQPVCGLLTGYNGTTNCDTGNFIDNISAVTTVEDAVENEIRFSNFGGDGYVVTAIANCNDMTIIIPYQSINGNTSVSGQGTFTSTGTITIYYTIIIGGVSTNCSFTMNRYNL
jgi:hypothetical protein